MAGCHASVRVNLRSVIPFFRLFAEVFFNSNAFEPSPLNFFYLVWNVHANGVAGRVLPRRLGLSANGGRRGFVVSTADAAGSKMSTTATGARADEPPGEEGDRQPVAVDTIRLGEFLNACSIYDAVPFVKLDCEGCEHEIVPQNADFFVSRVTHLAGELHRSEKMNNVFDRAQATTRRVLCRDRKRRGSGGTDTLHGCGAVLIMSGLKRARRAQRGAGVDREQGLPKQLRT